MPKSTQTTRVLALAAASLSAVLAVSVAVSSVASGTPEPKHLIGCYNVDGQRVCIHDEDDAAGYYHTYDALTLPGDSGVGGRKVHVFLPRDYAATGNTTRYPVVYFNDGQSIFFPNNDVHKTWKLQDALRDLYAQNAIPKVIIVAIYPRDREVEYTHDTVMGRPCCGLEGYSDFIATRFKPFIDRTYRTKPDRTNTAIVGSSHGGLAAFYIAGTHPAEFSRVAALSSSFWVGMSPVGSGVSLADSTLLDATRATLADSALRPRLYIDWGLVRTGGMHNSFIEAQATERSRELVELLTGDFDYKLGQNLMTVEDPAGEHSEDSWARRLPEMLRWLLR